MLKAGPTAGYTAEPPGGSEKTSTPRFLGPVSEFLGWGGPDKYSYIYFLKYVFIEF